MSLQFDDLLLQVGGWGWYQKRLWLLLTICGEAVVGQNMILMTFAGAAPERTCADRYNSSTESALAQNESSGCNCSRYDYAEDIFTIPRQLELYCERRYLADVLSALQMFGVLAGALLWGQLAEIRGRKQALVAIYLTLCPVGIGGAFAPTWSILAVAMFLLGVGLGGFWCVNYVIVQEAVAPEQRLFVSCINGWPVTIALFSLLTWRLPDWRWDLLILNCTGLSFLLFFLWVEESPRWLLQNGRRADCQAALARIAADNGTVCPDFDAVGGEQRRQKQYTYRHLFRNRAMTAQVAALAYSWFTASCVSYALGFNTKNLPGNRFLNMFLMGISAAIFNWFVPFFNNCGIGRRLLHQVSMIGALVCSAVVFVCYIAEDWWSLPPSSQAWLIRAFAVLGGSCLGPVWVVIYLYSSELFPTVVRNLGTGLCSVAARIGGITAPLILILGSDWPPLPWLLFSLLLAGNAAVAALGLPETRGRPLPDRLPPKEPLLGCWSRPPLEGLRLVWASIGGSIGGGD